ncbi:MAG: hypothetical protein HYU99_08785 [Deltaproteobacteria bacterium]|nr:hypothetical protein [Deltaproteobacteria bacterium]
MPNGFFGTQQEWEKLEAPLRQLDDLLATFVKKHDLFMTKNERHWPCRSIVWSDAIEKKIEIYASDKDSPLYSMWICAYQDRHGQRYWKKSVLKESVSFDEIYADISYSLDSAKKELDSWLEGDLEKI